MRQCNYVVDDIQSLEKYLKSIEIRKNIDVSKSILIQVFVLQEDYMFIDKLIKIIQDLVPKATIVGSTTCGQISSGKIINEKASIAISFFKNTDLKVFSSTCSKGKEKEIGNSLIEQIRSNCANIAGVLLLATPGSIETSELLMGMEEKIEEFPVFGGGAVAGPGGINSFVFNNLEIITQGIVAVVFLSKDLRVEAHTYIGWEALSKEMKITEIENNVTIKKIDGKSAFSVYEKYLGIKNDKNFDLNVMEFPFLLKRNGHVLARIPISCDSDGSMHFIADIRKDEIIRLSYGNPERIIKNSKNMQEKMQIFKPESIFLYSCMCRKRLMKGDIDLETEPFNSIAPTTGFYTYGEFFGHGKNLNLLNATMVVVGMSEDEEENIINNTEYKHEVKGIEQKSLVARLGHFIKIVAGELEEANKDLQELSYMDPLTKVYNHGKIDEIFIDEIAKVDKTLKEFSIVLIDIDKFKKINDKCGHYIGDQILEEFGMIFKNKTRDTDYIGRWGGEEFMIILPNTNKEEAIKISENIREEIANKNFIKIGNVTASMGVTTVNKYEDRVAIFTRADEALYDAKRNGRNRVAYR